MVDYKISNVVVSSYVADGISLDEVASFWPEANYNPMAFRAIAYSQDNPKTAQLIFDDGRVVSTGARSVKSAEMSVSNVGVELEKLGVPLYEKLFIEIDNIVARATLDKKLDLHHLAPKLENAEFDPGKFPGIIIKKTITKETVGTKGSEENVTASGVTSVGTEGAEEKVTASSVTSVGTEGPEETVGTEDPEEATEGKEYEVSTLIFSSGKIVLTGHKSEEEVKEAFGKIVDELGRIMAEEPDE